MAIRLSCESCGASLDPSSISGIFLKCPYCGSTAIREDKFAEQEKVIQDKIVSAQQQAQAALETQDYATQYRCWVFLFENSPDDMEAHYWVSVWNILFGGNVTQSFLSQLDSERCVFLRRWLSDLPDHGRLADRCYSKFALERILGNLDEHFQYEGADSTMQIDMSNGYSANPMCYIGIVAGISLMIFVKEFWLVGIVMILLMITLIFMQHQDCLSRESGVLLPTQMTATVCIFQDAVMIRPKQLGRRFDRFYYGDIQEVLLVSSGVVQLLLNSGSCVTVQLESDSVASLYGYLRSKVYHND